VQRAIFVPKKLLDVSGELPEEAKRAASLSHLQVVISDDGDEVKIGTIPHEKRMHCDSSIRSGFAHIIEIVDEFTVFSKTFVIEYSSPSGILTIKRPRVCERHKLFFVGRFTEAGTYNYSVFDFNIMDTRESRIPYCQGSFEVV